METFSPADGIAGSVCVRRDDREASRGGGPRPTVEGEDFDKPTGTRVVNDTILYSGGQALKFTNNTAIATGTVTSLARAISCSWLGGDGRAVRLP